MSISSPTRIVFSDSTTRSQPPVHSIALLFRAFIRTEANWASTIARVVLGFVMLPHGAQKLLGWFGGYGFTGTMNWFTGSLHVPWIFGFAAIMAEVVGALALIVGFASRLAAATIAAVFVSAVALVHGQHGFFINWFGNQKGEGVEYFILGVTLAAIVMIYGGGAASVDRSLFRRRAARMAL
jgi:putative oxidoreductase